MEHFTAYFTMKLSNAAEDILNPDALTIGFARRFATYKRGYLLFMDELST